MTNTSAAHGRATDTRDLRCPIW